MSVTVITTCDDITIVETLDDESIYEYINKIMDEFDDKNNVSIVMVINTGTQLITLKVK